MRITSSFVCSLAVCMLLMNGAEASAQASPQERTLIPVLVVLPSSADVVGQAVTVERHRGDGYRIVLPRHLATASNLRAAIRTLYDLTEDSVALDDQPIEVRPTSRAGLDNRATESLFASLMAAGMDGHRAGITIYLPAAGDRAWQRARLK